MFLVFVGFWKLKYMMQVIKTRKNELDVIDAINRMLQICIIMLKYLLFVHVVGLLIIFFGLTDAFFYKWVSDFLKFLTYCQLMIVIHCIVLVNETRNTTQEVLVSVESTCTSDTEKGPGNDYRFLSSIKSNSK